MSSALCTLLRLPTCLRAQAFRQTLPSSRLDHSIKRTFTTTLRTPKQNNRPAKKPSSLAPRGSPPPSSQQNATPPPRKPTPTPSRSPAPTYADGLLNHADPILLYKAAPHRSFYITSYLFGGLLLLGAYDWAIVVSLPPAGMNDQGSWGRYIMNGVTIGTTLVVSIFGTVLILAPVRMVGRVSLLRGTASGMVGEQGVRVPPVLRIEMESPLPFMKTKTFDLVPSEAFLDRTVSAVDIELTSIPLKDAKTFTATSHLRAGMPKLQHPPRDILSRSISTLTRDIRRMCYREGFAYMRSDRYGNWKVDLQHCELLDQGRPLDRLTVEDVRRGSGPVAWIKRAMMD
ncbi:hypothetical protein B0A55_02415 [Friedmanniomyces simplex]|uniref:Uncharacterized protein n=1 Tax=Friedmanniomyces simplex TaxID=329884 RepID=A0A4U0XRG8_9PEZI|nr:hypothetical protein B0A55_02415 [Friedmanniomyces simplex]